MSRLSAAIDRAQSLPARGEVASAPTPTAGGAVPGTWTFDDDGSQTPVRAEAIEEHIEAACHFPTDAAGKLVIGNADPIVVEQHRRLAALIHRAQIERGVTRVMVASAVAAEGKTLTATNIALTLSHSYQRRVLLIDADLRRPSLHTMFGVAATQGLIDCLRGQGSQSLPVVRVAPMLWLLPGGRAESDPMGALVSDTMKQLLLDAGEQFDCVVIDTPPVALMPDAHLLAGMVDAAILIINAGGTPYPLVRRAIASIGPARILGAVLNRAPHAAVAGGYGPSYGSYATGARVPAPGLGAAAHQ